MVLRHEYYLKEKCQGYAPWKWIFGEKGAGYQGYKMLRTRQLEIR